ncbi:hypothetical protein T439DRAFT_289065 [Meredithblackwellia eburnea MCA 4105]
MTFLHKRGHKKCGLFWKARRVSWSWLVGSTHLSSLQPLISRPIQARSWLQANLDLSPVEIYTMPDPKRRSFRILDSREKDTPEDLGHAYKFAKDLQLSEIQAIPHRLLEFGSLFGGTRLRFRKELHVKVLEESKLALNFRDEMLERTSDAVADRLGGRGNYVGLHLRIGGPSEFEGAPERNEEIFRKLCTKQYGLSNATIDRLLSHESQEDALPEKSNRADRHQLSSTLKCLYPQYPADSAFSPLNTPLFIATDVPRPRSSDLIQLFIKHFPCTFFLSDFFDSNSLNQLPVRELEFLEKAVDEEGVKMRPFLEPFVDAEVTAKARNVSGSKIFL